MLTCAEIRTRLRHGQPCIGTWLQIPSPDSAEILARLGYAWAALDMEHGSFTRAILPDMFRALERWGVLPFVRLPEATMRNIKDALDSGARGLIFPMIETRSQLDEAISRSLYPGGKVFSAGRRGVGFSRANSFGLDFEAHTKTDGLGQDIILVAQIEHLNALSNLDDIFSHPRLDAYMVGPYDLSASMGCTGKFDNPDFIEALLMIEKKAVQYDVPKGYHVVTPEAAAVIKKVEEGYTFIAYGIDTLFLMEGGRCPQIPAGSPK
jgi:2-dehydro-3-deoxyglucarate aldolase